VAHIYEKEIHDPASRSPQLDLIEIVKDYRAAVAIFAMSGNSEGRENHEFGYQGYVNRTR
jgi:hypothetical protein